MLQWMFISVLPVLLTLNPDTGDRNAGVMTFVIIALIVSAALIVGYLVTSSKKNGKNGKDKRK